MVLQMMFNVFIYTLPLTPCECSYCSYGSKGIPMIRCVIVHTRKNGYIMIYQTCFDRTFQGAQTPQIAGSSGNPTIHGFAFFPQLQPRCSNSLCIYVHMNFPETVMSGEAGG